MLDAVHHPVSVYPRASQHIIPSSLPEAPLTLSLHSFIIHSSIHSINIVHHLLDTQRWARMQQGTGLKSLPMWD